MRSRLARDLSWRRPATPSTLARAVATAGVLGLILAGGLIGGFAHFRTGTVEYHEPPFAADTIEAWLRHMTVTRAAPPHNAPGPPPLDVPEGL